ncbi:hypothetical protein [Pseudoclavibacter helvolus]|uniref:hypothetical protein n=1 Tax=Pseudoclavibacter helvolus TaxID=255205 RepID=UPI0008387CE5|nr:hypothetical protein [Pseudoclavibacter helvolus]
MQGIEKLNGHTVETELGALLDRIIVGSLGLHELTPSIAGFITYGFDQGRTSRDREVAALRQQLARAERDRDTYYERLMNPGVKLTELHQRREQQALDLFDQHDQLTEATAFAAVITAHEPAARAA